MPAAAVSSGTTEGATQRLRDTWDLGASAGAATPPAPCLIIVGRVVALAPALAWHGERELTDA